MRYLPLIAIIALAGCGKSDPYREVITKEFVKVANDPDKFDYVETVAVDTVTNGEWWVQLKERNESRAAESTRQFESAEASVKTWTEFGNESLIADYSKEAIERREDAARYTAEADSVAALLSGPDVDKVFRYDVLCKVRSTNKLGALVLETVKVTMGPDLKIIGVVDPEDQ